MKKNRYIPFGYTMKDGRLIIEKTEAAVIRRIFEQYVHGSSLKEIADKLTKERVPYSEKKTDWGKARVARIIENEKYLGDEEHDLIIEDSLFREAAEVKAARLTAVPGDLNSEIGFIKGYIRCGKCGSRMTRKSGKKIKTKQEWTCMSPDCRCRTGISDETLLGTIIRILTRIQRNEHLLEDPVKKRLTAPPELKKQLNDELEKGAADQERILQIIFAIASEQYNRMCKSPTIQAEEIKRKIRRIEIRETFSPELFYAIVSEIRIGDGKLILVTKNYIEIGENYGDNEDTEENSDSHNS